MLRLAAGAASAPRPIERLPLDPKLRPRFDDTANEKRTAAELDTWWARPFGRAMADGGIEVRCLDGGAWDRSTFYGVARPMEEAQELAARKIAKWREFLDTPMSYLAEGVFVRGAASRPPRSAFGDAAHARPGCVRC